MNKYLLNKNDDDQDEYVIYQYSDNSDVISKYPIYKVIFDMEDDFCPHCTNNVGLEILKGYLDPEEFGEEYANICKECEACSNFELLDELTRKEERELLTFLENGHCIGGTSVEDSLHEDGKYLGEFKNISECRKYLKENKDFQFLFE